MWTSDSYSKDSISLFPLFAKLYLVCSSKYAQVASTDNRHQFIVRVTSPEYSCITDIIGGLNGRAPKYPRSYLVRTKHDWFKGNLFERLDCLRRFLALIRKLRRTAAGCTP